MCLEQSQLGRLLLPEINHCQLVGHGPELHRMQFNSEIMCAVQMSMGGMDMGGMQMDMSSPSPDMQMGMGSKNMMAPSSKAMSPSVSNWQDVFDSVPLPWQDAAPP